MIRPDADKLRLRVRQLILMRETGPKSAAWHMARMRLIWNLHDRIHAVERQQHDEHKETNGGEESGD